MASYYFELTFVFRFENTKEEDKYGVIIPLSFINSEKIWFKTEIVPFRSFRHSFC